MACLTLAVKKQSRNHARHRSTFPERWGWLPKTHIYIYVHVCVCICLSVCLVALSTLIIIIIIIIIVIIVVLLIFICVVMAGSEEMKRKNRTWVSPDALLRFPRRCLDFLEKKKKERLSATVFFSLRAQNGLGHQRRTGRTLDAAG